MHHSLIGQAYLQTEWNQNSVLPKPILQVVLSMVGGHHGTFHSQSDVQEAGLILQCDEPPIWGMLRAEALQLLQDQFLNTDFSISDGGNISAQISVLTGFAILCDWLASNGLHFPPSAHLSLQEYIPLSVRRATLAVQAAGFTESSASRAPTVFAHLFSNLPNPRPLQTAIDLIPAEIVAHPCLAVIEAPTGEGKTEAALALAHRLAVAQGSDEFYYALPTTATSNQIYARVQNYLHKHLRLNVAAKLIHSQAFLREDELEFRPLQNGEDDTPLVSLEWFSSKKRALLAPFGVGTIDQAELAALNVRHHVLRMVGLAGKILILDEVHAYDTYMTTIIERLLEWLSVLGTSVIILSATLPNSRRRRLIHAYGADPPPDIPQAYPALLVCGKTKTHCQTPAVLQPNRIIQIEHLDLDRPEDQAQWLLNQIEQGGCVCWIANTVRRAQELYQSLLNFASADVHLALLHSRFPVGVRTQIEREVAARYGPDGERPACGIVVGTQVLEQSLDLDFDRMVTDLAPVDLLLQRAGRLHRHQRLRPAIHQYPKLHIHVHCNPQGEPDISIDKRIYAEYILLRTWQTLRGVNQFQLPADYRRFIQAVYDECLFEDEKTALAWRKLQEAESDARSKAKTRLVPLPHPRDPYSAASALMVFEENEDCVAWVVAPTRLGEAAVTVIPLQKSGERCFLYDSDLLIDLDQPAERETQLAMLRQSLKISGDCESRLIRAVSQPIPTVFRKSALLRNVLPLFFDQHGQAELKNKTQVLHFNLDPRLGLVIKLQKG